MPVIQIPFKQSLANVSISCSSVTKPTPRSTSPTQSVSDSVAEPDNELDRIALQTLESIDSNIQRLNARIDEEFASVSAQLVAAATQVAKEALGSENSFIEERVAHFAEVLLQQIHPSQSAVFFVNPDCIPVLESWMSASHRRSIDIQPDYTVQPGDCRIESEGKGFLASLESFMDAAANRISFTKGAA